MASILPFLARYAATGAAGLLAGQDQRRQRLIAETLQRQQLDRQARLDAAAEADRQQRLAAAQRTTAIEDLQLANPGGAIVPRARALEPVPMLGGPLGPVAARVPTVDPNYVTAGDYATDTRNNAETRAAQVFERQQTAAEAQAERQARNQALIQQALDARQQAALDAQNRRLDATLSETARHNRAMEARPVPGQLAPTRQPPAQVTQGIVTNNVALQQIDEAIKLVDQYPGAFGVSNAMGGSFVKDQLSPNPANIAARAAIADLSSMQIHNRTGAAMSKSEWERLRPFLPTDVDNPTTVKTKLQGLRKQIERETAQMQTLYGARVPSGAFADPSTVGTPPGHADRSPSPGVSGQDVLRKYGIPAGRP
jgi:hypothetical protein